MKQAQFDFVAESLIDCADLRHRPALRAVFDHKPIGVWTYASRFKLMHELLAALEEVQ